MTIACKGLVTISIANHHGALGLHVGTGFEQFVPHARLRLAARVGIAGSGGIEDAFDTEPIVFGKDAAHLAMDVAEGLLGHHATPDAALVGDHKDTSERTSQQGGPLEELGTELELLPRLDIIAGPTHVDGAVAIEQQRVVAAIAGKELELCPLIVGGDADVDEEAFGNIAIEVPQGDMGFEDLLFEREALGQGRQVEPAATNEIDAAVDEPVGAILLLVETRDEKPVMTPPASSETRP